MTRPPEFEELFDVDEAGEDAAELRRMHDLLVRAGPPPELSPALHEPPRVLETRPHRRRRRTFSMQSNGLRYLAAAAAIAAVAFGIGRVTAREPGDFSGARTVGLQATAAAPRATGTLEIAATREEGNWPMRLTTSRLPKLKGDAYYAVFLTRDGKIVGPCGFFRAGRAPAEAYLNAPYELDGVGWVVTLQHPGDRKIGPVLLRTTAATTTA